MPIKRVTRKPTGPSLPPAATVREAVRQWFAARQEVAFIEKHQADLRKLIEPVLEAQPKDDAGHRWLYADEDEEFPGGYRGLKWERRTRHLLDEVVAERILRKKGLWDRCQARSIRVNDVEAAIALLTKHGLLGGAVEVVEELDQDEISKAHYEGKISEAEIDAIITKSYSYALVPVRK